MNGLETLRTAISAILSRKLRSGLTMLGILIGVAAVMLTVGLGQGAQQTVTAEINSLGSNLLVVTPGSTTSANGIRGGFGSATTLTLADADLLANTSNCPDVAAVAPIMSSSQSVTSSTSNWTTTVVGTTPGWLPVRARTVTSGRYFSAREAASGAPVAVIGSTTASQLFSGSPIGQSVTINGTVFTVIGELNTAGSSIAGDQDDTILIPISTFAQRIASSSQAASVSSIYLEAAGQSTLSAAYQEAQQALDTAHGTTTASADFSIASQASLVQTATSTTRTLTVLLGGIAAISLLVGGIGVMNIMLVSVTERIREIGLRKALGAAPAVILRQFLTEASLLGLIGGALGVAVGIAGARLLPGLIGQPVSVSLLATLGALVVSLLIGIIAGVYPASRAARLAPIDALRME
ncbi:MAG TPA: ABC transporter permease [Propionibacteriaceae bacterium]|nr:ABC transporter permease [Propionibacteriaceae bacterium]